MARERVHLEWPASVSQDLQRPAHRLILRGPIALQVVRVQAPQLEVHGGSLSGLDHTGEARDAGEVVGRPGHLVMVTIPASLLYVDPRVMPNGQRGNVLRSGTVSPLLSARQVDGVLEAVPDRE